MEPILPVVSSMLVHPSIFQNRLYTHPRRSQRLVDQSAGRPGGGVASVPVHYGVIAGAVGRVSRRTFCLAGRLRLRGGSRLVSSDWPAELAG